jgi:predicted transcriptional regulator
VTRQTLTVDELAALLGVSAWSVYLSGRRGHSPVRPIRAGRRVLFAKGAVEQVLGALEAEP